MARGASGRLVILCLVEEAETDIGASLGRSRLEHAIDYQRSLEGGTSDGQITRVWSGEVSLTTTPTDIDLQGSLASALNGAAVTMVELTGIVIENRSAAGNILVGGDAASVPIFAAVNDVAPIGPGGISARYEPAGFPVTATTGDIVQLAASAGTVVARVVLYGRHA